MKSLNEKDLKSIVGGAYVCTYERIYQGPVYHGHTTYNGIKSHDDYYMGKSNVGYGTYKYGKPWL